MRDRLRYRYLWMRHRWLPAVLPIRHPTMMKNLHGFLKTPLGHRLEHTGYVFAAAFAVTAYGNRDHLLAAHGLDGLKSAGYALAAGAFYAGLAAIKPLLLKDAADLAAKSTTPPKK